MPDPSPEERGWAWLTPPLILIVLGTVVLVAGIALVFSWRIAVIAAGVMLLAGGVDLARPDPPRPDMARPDVFG